ncbi:outer membrane immunogenic protein [Sphingobium sp. B2D3A]|uniref:outer membrane protein n=1 Tax=Sphingobium TaxID=165695 RepID=UPI0015EC82C6|nr:MULTISPECIES: outer membrane beta-barrel protein [Sphingobium]MCW2335945.1 outer membrane immunogenic protein [Sphingobium sp. B2D3A]MCW2349337.1 outer membrane immunogenic protein [Sphingobium sp. B12D2B]MCW2363980.1 outer membrane immunogenic protein [Sphingobium sp. B10D3B]MCW2385704.1 outer membrane immunogenic protein [Sphingobium sp. B2D3D]MCW2402623.1 outer membrane immunogenic protein [Sphingobium sp. B10D7B]
MKLAVLASAAAVIVATPAAAQEGPTFSGLSLAVLGGYDSVRLSDGVDNGSSDDFAYGVSLGYNADLGSAVVGVEVEAADSEVKESVTDQFVTGDELSLSAARDLYVGVRAGAKLAPNALIYAKAGYTNARLKVSYTDGVDSVSDGDNLDGYRLGAGVEYSFGRFGIRGEYRFSDYGKLKFDDVDTGISMQRHQVMVGLVGKF